VPWLNKFLSHIPLAAKMDNFLIKADVSYPLGVFLLLSVVLALVGFLLLSLVLRSFLLSLSGLVLGFVALRRTQYNKNRRMKNLKNNCPMLSV